jgi:hypothetical protein
MGKKDLQRMRVDTSRANIEDTVSSLPRNSKPPVFPIMFLNCDVNPSALAQSLF